MKTLFMSLILAFVFILPVYPQQSDDLQLKKIDNDRLKHFPVPEDGRNYFFLLSIENATQIVIGDFMQGDKKIILINLDSDYNTIKSVVEYYPGKNKLRVRKESESKFFTTDIAKLKKDIISGAIFKNNSTDDMKSYDSLENVFRENDTSKVFPDVYGFNVKLADIDETHRYSAMFTFGKAIHGYYLQFKTIYNKKTYSTEITPVLKYSVYCKNTNDPVVKEYVENLFKIRKPASVDIK
jgi:hypothetical protein